jgi:hypothetical protein
MIFLTKLQGAHMLREVFRKEIEEVLASNSFFSLYDFSLEENKRIY